MKTYYKAFKKDMTCRGFKYAEGETYEIEGEPILCENGFHFCKDLVLTLEYYPAVTITDNKYAIVEPLGQVVFEEPTKHKGVTNKIKIVRILSDEEVLAMIDGHSNSGNSNSGDSNSGYRNSGDNNSGDNNSGHSNSGNSNSGNSNSGYRNSGYSNSGYRNSGDNNSGHSNSGDNNSGHNNSGYRNSGNSNSGNSNSGCWNSCNFSSGFFNSTTQEQIYVFDKLCSLSAWEKAYKPEFLFFTVTEWIQEDRLTDQEKIDDPNFYLRGGQLRRIDYKTAFKNAWDAADPNDRIRIKELPNFDAAIFFEISGITIEDGKK